MDGVIVVVHTGIVTESDLKLTKARLEGVGGRVLGVVMNRFRPESPRSRRSSVRRPVP